VAKIANAVLYVTRRRYLLTRGVSIRAAAGILSTSLAFAAVSLGSLASQQVGFLWLAHVAGPAAAVPLGVMLRLHAAAFGVVLLVTQPLWPAVADAVARHDSAWARRAYRRASWLTVLYAAAYGVGLVTAGSLLIRVWTGTHVQVPLPMMFLFGLYFIAGVWQHVNAITLVGLGKVWVAARVLCLEAAIASVGAVMLMTPFGAMGVIVAFLVATAAVSGTLLPPLVRRSWPADLRSVGPPPVSDGTMLSR
jgi:O-antigen/teichoic acid export membrane protein